MISIDEVKQIMSRHHKIVRNLKQIARSEFPYGSVALVGKHKGLIVCDRACPPNHVAVRFSLNEKTMFYRLDHMMEWKRNGNIDELVQLSEKVLK